ncbi:MAG TPA: dihydrofolate reductase family protein [Daejeonella sp.]|uniref:dihydrofolate reductase family protein n=1 Tax=Daejeonella sp. TaxID=2805397 RepID=UPI002ED9A2B3
MRKITAFMFLTINGRFKGPNEDISWHIHGEEGNEFSEDQLKADNILLFGRKTYEMMMSFWPTKMAYDSYPNVAERMNKSEKIVLSNSLRDADWQNTTILSGNTIEQIRELKNTSGKNITILGSGTIINQLTDAGLIDQYEFLIDPIAIGIGTPLFNNISSKLELALIESKLFKKSGAVLLIYARK